MKNQYPLLARINSPADLRALPEADLPALCNELRQFIINHLSHEPGHFASSLGVVELTVALHYVYDTPRDPLIFDVGHQAYAHKILTGRRDRFDTLRQLGGLSGFPSIKESTYDAFGVGHASTSISAALGMATAFALQNQTNQRTVCVIGDGAMTGGEAFEALNNLGDSKANVLVVLNDNHISIDRATGSMSQYLLDITTGRHYNRLRRWLVDHLRERHPGRKGPIASVTKSLKALITSGSNMFESLGLRYFGPANGHDVRYLVQLLRDLRNIEGPKLLHVVTVKGKGFAAAEADPTTWHAVSAPFDPMTGSPAVTPNIKTSATSANPTTDATHRGAEVQRTLRFQDVAGDTVLNLAKRDNRVVAISPAMISGSGLTPMMQEFPNRTFDVGICEEHAVTFAAGLATQGIIPYVFIYSTFAQRAIDQIIHDVALQNLHVIFCLDRAGLVGPDGPTHHGVFDIPLLRCIPNITICSPYSGSDLRDLMTWALNATGPIVIRYPRGGSISPGWCASPQQQVQSGRSRQLRKGHDVALLSFGHIGTEADKAADILLQQGISCAHYDLRFAKPLDTQLLEQLFKTFHIIVTIEDGAITAGIGEAINNKARHDLYNGHILNFGIPDRFVPHGNVNDLRQGCHCQAEDIANEVTALLQLPPL